MTEQAQMSEGAKKFWKLVGLVLLVLFIGWILNLTSQPASPGKKNHQYCDALTLEVWSSILI